MSNYSDSSFGTDRNSSWYKIYHLIQNESHVLDIGCSSGNFGEELIKKKNCVVDGIELDYDDYEKAKTKLNKVFNLNIETDDLSIITERYDYIYFGDVIEHLVNPVHALQRIKPLLKKDGYVLFSLPNMSHASVRFMLLGGDFEYGETGLLDKTHLHFYTEHELNRVMNQAGLEIVTFDPVIKDYPKDLIDKELKKVGLAGSDEFYRFINTSNASIYQLVGAAKYSKNPRKVKVNKVSPRDTFAKLLDETRAYYEKRLKESDTHIAKLQTSLDSYHERVQELEKLISKSIINRIKKRLGR